MKASRQGGKKPAPRQIRQIKRLEDVSSLDAFVITQTEWDKDGLFEKRRDPSVSLTFSFEEAVQATIEIAHDTVIEAGASDRGLKLVWRGYPDDDWNAPYTEWAIDGAEKECWHLDLLYPDGALAVADFAMLSQVDVTDTIAEMPEQILETMKEIRAEGDDIDMLMTPTRGRA